MITKNKVGVVIAVAIILIIVIANLVFNNDNNKGLTIGAILPMTGPASLWGETVKNGMDLALENTKGINVKYEDCKSTAVGGIGAYNLLKTKGVNLFFSELSLVSVPLSKLALENKTPLLVSQVAAEHSSIVNDYTMRYYTDPTNYATPAFTSEISPVLKAQKLAILTRNDDLGNSVKAKIIELSKANNKQIVFAESFVPAENDFRSMILKVKSSGADVFMFVASTPGEAVGILQTAKQIGLQMPIVEASAVFADLDTRKQVSGIPFYSTSYDFSSPGNAVEFKTAYKIKYGREPNFGAAFGYDMIKFIDRCKTESENTLDCLNDIREINGTAGMATQVELNDFTVKMHLEKVN